ncbi:MAG: DUF3224 domain-containing protein [Sphingomonadaceae bacterium]
MTSVSGSFEVQLGPEALSATAAGSGLSRMSLDKRFHGPLDATSKGEMLSFLDRGLMSGGYVAMELVQGTLAGKRGSFVLQHSGSMVRGAPGLLVTVVADSGREELAGLRGTLVIRIEGGQHFYDFDYTLEPIAAA